LAVKQHKAAGDAIDGGVVRVMQQPVIGRLPGEHSCLSPVWAGSTAPLQAGADSP